MFGIWLQITVNLINSYLILDSHSIKNERKWSPHSLALFNQSPVLSFIGCNRFEKGGTTYLQDTVKYQDVVLTCIEDVYL